MALLLLLAGSLVASEPVTEAQLQQRFAAAGNAYDAGNIAEAIAGYEALLNDGVRSPALDYNMGNALFKQGRLGEAVLHYRRAWYAQPRDPDIEANMRFALENAGAVAPQYSFLVKTLHSLSMNEWFKIGMAAGWLLAGVICLGLFLPATRFATWRIGIVLLVILVISGVGAGIWWSLIHQPECVVIEQGQKARSGPLADATALFAVPEGAITAQQERNGAWVRIRYDKQTGWLPAASCPTVN